AVLRLDSADVWLRVEKDFAWDDALGEFVERGFRPMLADRVVAQLAPGATADALRDVAGPLGLAGVTGIPGTRLVQVELAAFRDPMDLPRALLQLGGLEGVVEFAEPDYLLFACDTYPNDPLFESQRALRNPWSSSGAAEADIEAAK